MALSEEQQQRISRLSREVGQRLLQQEAALVTAESCTGGWIAQAITETAGSSDWFNAGIVSYSNAAKHRLLGVSNELLDTYGAVSQQVVEAMAQGAVDLNFGQVSVAVSGIAGPSGGSAEKTVGTVWIGWSVNEIISSSKFLFAGDREQVRYQTLVAALEGLLSQLK
ncbi:CinA family protein [Litoribrevibacter albus]|uniref:Competence damage-inducible protein A n=1 Tax=Litoribrevibacter albus TaxID=1473156 RepID=A0AA37S8F4_9GAMM|nr:CinA family protein [Litoribrevibacter albus]GLQ31147.1 competence damage-inducible protein A [Litoribrevibacter albus]